MEVLEQEKQMNSDARCISGNSYWRATIIQSECAQNMASRKAWPCEDAPIELTLFVSCYNEEAYIEDTLKTVVASMALVNKTYEILVIDDCSKDKSVALVQAFIRKNPDINITLRINEKNKGLAQNFVDGAFIGQGKYYRLICGDNAEPMDTIVRVLRAIGKADMIVPYYVSAKGKNLSRRTISKLYTMLVNLASGHHMKYYNGLQVYLRHNVMRWHPSTRGFGFQAELLCLLLDKGLSYKQVPCVTVERRGGMGNAITWKNFRSVAHVLGGIFLKRITL